MSEEEDFLAQAERVRQEQVGSQGGTGDPAVQGAVDHAQQTAGSGPPPGSQEPGFFGLGGLSSSEVEAQKQDIAQQSYAAPASGQPESMAAQGVGVEQQAFLAEAEQMSPGAAAGEADPDVQGAVDHADATAGSGPEPGSQEPGYLGMGGLSKSEVEAQKQDIAQQSYAAQTTPEQEYRAAAPSVGQGQAILAEAQEVGDEQQFLADAQQVRDEQLASGTGGVDPAVQAAVDHASETAGSGPEPGSEQPGFFGLGGLSKSEIEAQKQDIAGQSHRGD
jgi:hypothetical protein